MPTFKNTHFQALAASMLACLLLAGCRTPRLKTVEETAGKTSSGRVVAPVVPADWKLSVQAYTYRKFSFLAAVDACASMGIRYIEAYPGQKIGGSLPGKFHHSMADDAAARLRDELSRRNVTLVAYGVVNGKDADEWRQIFRFAQTMGIGTICTEPPQDALDAVCALADEFEINVALHNHAKPSRYWDPATVLAACEGRTARIGACADNGHWARSGLRGTDAAKLLQGRIRWFHLKDVDAPAKHGHCVPFGTGAAAVNDLLAELRRQEFKGFFSIEYESDPANPSPVVKACVDYFFKARTLDADKLLRDAPLPAGMARDIASTWASLDLETSGKWETQKLQKAPALAGYVDATDGIEGEILASGEGFERETFTNSFDNTEAKWCIKTPTIWVQYGFPTGMAPKVTAYTIMSANDAPARDPRNWQLLGSQDGATWTVLDTRKEENFTKRHFVNLYKIGEPAAYRFYKLNVTQNRGAEESQLGEIELLVKRTAKKKSTSLDIAALFALAREPKGYSPVFSPDLSDAIMQEGGWTLSADGVLKPQGKGDIWTKKQYSDFVIDLEFKCVANTNSGVFIRCDNIKKWLHRAIEVQVLQANSANKKHICGSIFDCLAPTKYAVKPVGEWNHYTVIAKADRILVELNGERILDADLSKWTTAGKNPDGSRNKFKYAYGSMPRKGHLGLQYHGQDITFRNVRIKEL